MTAPASTTIADELRRAAHVLRDAGLPDGRREAIALWAALAGTSPGDAWRRQDALGEAPAAERFRIAVARRARGIPFAYAAGSIGFRGVELRVDPRALIPRPETEGLVELVLDWSARRALRAAGGRWGGGIAVDVGTGCGCIALALAVEGRFERVIAIERSGDAVALARENAARVAPPPTTPVDVHHGELLAPLGPDQRVRVVVANPPYLTEAEYAALDRSVRDYEPRDALLSGPDGLAATRALVRDAMPVVEPGGLLALEVDERRADAVQALARRHGWHDVTVREDLFGRPRYVLGVRGGES